VKFTHPSSRTSSFLFHATARSRSESNAINWYVQRSIPTLSASFEAGRLDTWRSPPRSGLIQLHDNPEASTLNECLRSHEQRVSLIGEEIQRRGGKPAQGSGPWGAFAKLLEGGAKLFGVRAAIAVLEEGEDHGRDDYKRDAPKL